MTACGDGGFAGDIEQTPRDQREDDQKRKAEKDLPAAVRTLLSQRGQRQLFENGTLPVAVATGGHGRARARRRIRMFEVV